MILELVTYKNYKKAIDIQKRIFPQEDGTINILASIDRDLFINKTGINYIDDNVKYYIAKFNGKYVGITGLYDYQNKDEVWIAWFGILPDLRNHGLGKLLLESTINLAKENEYKTIRLYTDKVENAEAIKLYEKLGFLGEKYSVEELDFDCWIYSKSLIEDDVTLWNNKNLNLSYQSELENIDKDKIEEILNIYNNFNN